ncbi:MAG: ATP-binding cassette domain-containing protein [Bacillales bacterium]|nr:ATP-binding cassette domain-containing protein [Bacillales bacterium]
MLKLENVGKIYNSEGTVAVGIRKVNLELRVGEFVAITGESGSGKTTLLNVISGIDTYEEGEMYVNGEETSYFSTEDLENYRNRYVGFIFQNYNVIDSFSVLENVEAALIFDNQDKKARREKAISLIERVGLKDQLKTKASKLSGGEKQRVVIARALAKDAPIIAADEPTGNLDSKASSEIIELLHEVSKDKLVLIVTHDFEEVEKYATRLIRVFDGEVKEDRILKEENQLRDLPSIPVNEKLAKKRDIITLGSQNVFASPKRAIFHIFVFLFLSVFFIASFAIYRTAMNDLHNTNSFSQFSNMDPTRIVVNKDDHSAFTEAELNELKALANVKNTIDGDIATDTTRYLYITGEDYSYNFRGYSNLSTNLSLADLVCGRLPAEEGEIVITADEDDLTTEYDSYDDFLDKTIISSYSNVYKVVGVIDASKESQTYTYYTYYYPSDYENIKRNSLFNYYYAGFEIDGNSMYVSSVVLDETLGANEMAYSEFTPDDYQVYLSDFYQVYFDGTYHFTVNAQADSILYLGSNLYNEFTEKVDTVYQISVFVDNANKTDTTLKAIQNLGYRAVSVSEVGSSYQDIISAIMSIVFFVLLSFFLVAAFFITYVTMLHSVKSRKDDIEILRTIGATKDNIKGMLITEFSLVALICFTLVLIIYFVLLLTLNGYALDIIKAIGFTDFLFLFLILLVISVLLSLLYSRKLFKKSVKRSLDQK